jgi:cell shape-determining protein MreD
MDATTQALLLYTALQVCAFVGLISRALPGKEQQTQSYQAQGNLLPILLLSFVGYLLFLFG